MYNPGAVIVDINQRRRGKYPPGRGQRLVSADSLAALAPDPPIITHPTYTVETKEHAARMESPPEFRIL
jgi:hypothetical protein